MSMVKGCGKRLGSVRDGAVSVGQLMLTAGDRKKPAPGAFLNDLKDTMPLPEKLFLLLMNNSRTVFPAQSFCGHPGEPGR